MLKRFSITAATLSLLFGLSAAPISPEQALDRLGRSGMARVKTASSPDLQLAYTSRTAGGEAGAYIFTPAGAPGFVILSADDTAVPVLGYSDSGRIDAANLPPALVWWLGEQAARVEYAREKGVDVPAGAPYAPAGMSAVSPLLTTTWNQDAPYNNECPTVNGSIAPTGCVATSFAQVMNYFEYPEKGEGTLRYSDNGVLRTMILRQNFAWDQMLDTYVNGYTQEQADAVAYLMKACGYSIEMQYGRYASGAVSFKLVKAATQNFKYDLGTRYTVREFYSLDQWMKLVHDNLKNVGPVIYDGRSIEGGHSFVCDGYDGKGYFHFNWGWGGVSDGYYVLDSLNPESQGIGGYEGGFNNGQGIILGMQPPTGENKAPQPLVRIYGTAVAELSGSDIIFKAVDSNMLGWGNGSFTNFRVNVGAIFTKVGETAPAAEVQGSIAYTNGNKIETLSLGPASYIQSANANPVVEIPNLADGEYTVTLASKDTEREDASWVPMICNWGDVNYCLLKVEGGKYTVTSVAPALLELENCRISSPLYYGRNVKVVSTIKNESDKQLTLIYSPVLERDGMIQYEGDNMIATVEPGQTLEKDALVRFVPTPNATATGAGTYTLKVMDRATGSIIDSFGSYEMTNISSKTVLTLEDFSVVGATQEDVVSGTREFKNTYKFGMGDDLKVHLEYEVEEGYLDNPVRIVGTKYDPEAGRFVSLGNSLYSDTPFIGEGDVFNKEIPVNMGAFPAGFVYSLTASYKSNGQNKSLGAMYVTFDASGVVSVISESLEDARYFNLQGVEVEHPQEGQLLIRVCNGKTEKIRF